MREMAEEEASKIKINCRIHKDISLIKPTNK